MRSEIANLQAGSGGTGLVLLQIDCRGVESGLDLHLSRTSPWSSETLLHK